MQVFMICLTKIVIEKYAECFGFFYCKIPYFAFDCLNSRMELTKMLGFHDFAISWIKEIDK